VRVPEVVNVRVPVMVNHGVPVGACVWVFQQESGSMYTRLCGVWGVYRGGEAGGGAAAAGVFSRAGGAGCPHARHLCAARAVRRAQLQVRNTPPHLTTTHRL
jgi:hypothetical protein